MSFGCARALRAAIFVGLACANADAARTLTYYVDFERTNVTYFNPEYYVYVNASASRYGRRDPIHYVHIHGETRVPFGNNVTINIYIYEFLSNEYRRSFVEMHYRTCDFIDKDTVFRPFIKHALPDVGCPFPVGAYHFMNLSFPDFPLLRSFPFKKGRLFIEQRGRTARILNGFIDMEVKQRWR
ncbi:uncharacterized protein LOC125242118 [Leguminivora glycinivorella]|uniref:uncharacterized protein LOC125238068 n=1 Tax=Leguminivora glycinivorella TaxID=1035111 RepID=UPI00200D5974|nr:uncharacterized protein LOC125238068 [Leguminivora glycinivorella]XP_048006782.1 uncharacterized protein LOC125242118 [Leguminivora glycinivorella]